LGNITYNKKIVLEIIIEESVPLRDLYFCETFYGFRENSFHQDY